MAPNDPLETPGQLAPSCASLHSTLHVAGSGLLMSLCLHVVTHIDLHMHMDMPNNT